ncbi:hypothetical protein AB0A05_24710 [Streptomyces sp. NPDC046374]|uniref:hypothetical protein n=1 Tax=Streptomyces sp. NPDC046374 TaxID=3154917 RepID=UPI0033D772BC
MQQHARARTRKALALATTLGIAAGLTATVTGGPASAAPAATTATDEVVVPDPGRFKPRGEELVQVGPTGYLHRQEGAKDLLWTDAATGATKTASPLADEGHSGLYLDQGDGGPLVTDIATGATTLIPIRPGLRWSDAYTADTAVAGSVTNGVTTGLSLFSAGSGAPAERVVTGVPVDGIGLTPLAQDSRGAVLLGRNAAHYLDYATATLTTVAGSTGGDNFRLSAGHVLRWKSGTGTVYTTPRANPSAAPVATQVADPSEGLVNMDFAVVGDWVIAARWVPYEKQPYVLGEKLRAVPLGGGTAKELLRGAEAKLGFAPDGSVLAVGGESATDWAVRRVTPGEDGSPTLSTVRAVPEVPATYTGLALGAGRLSYVSNSWGADNPGLYDVDTDLTGTPSAGKPRLRHTMPGTTEPAFPQTGLQALGDGDSVLYDRRAGTFVSPLATSGFRQAIPPNGGLPVAAAGRYAMSAGSGKHYVMNLDNSDHSGLELTVTGAAALWAGKVWKTAAVAGQVNSYDLATRSTSAPVDLGSGCAPTELQALGRWIYWACAPAGKAGVYDQTLKKNVPVPTGQALLGDGYLVRHVGAELQLTDTATGATSPFADLPAAASGTGRGTTWTVDKFGGGVAYIDSANDIHVKRVDLARQALAPLDRTVPDLDFQGDGVEPTAAPWSPVWRFSRPVGSWDLRIAKGNGEGVRTLKGTTATGTSVRPQWDGKDALGRGVESGQYRWELVARPLDGVGPVQSIWGAFNITGSSLTTLPGTYTPVTPARLMDTRSGLGVPKAKLGADGKVLLKVAGQAGVPAEGLSAVVLNVTATNATASSFVSAYPHETQRTSASNLNFKAGQTSANLVTVPVVDGWVEFYNRAGSVDLLADIAGYYTEGTAGSRYQPVTPKRLMDTRNGTGVAKAKVAANGTVTLPVTEPGATAVVMNVTATNPTATSFVSVYPYGTTRTAASNLNFTAGQTVPNLVIVPVKDGKVTFYNKYGTVDLLADVAGYFKKDTGSVFTGMQPKRLMDTRDGTGVAQGKIGAGKTVSLAVGYKYSAVVLNVTATGPTATGFVSVYPYGTTRTAASNLNFVAGQTVPNLVVVPVKDGRVTFYNHSGTVDLIADIAGYYTG